ncbi:MAG: hypothetical protein ACRC4T_03060 [Cetobacterium sp.]
MNKGNINRLQEDMAKLFYNFDMEEFENKEAKRIIKEVSEKNKKLKEKISYLEYQLNLQKNKNEENKKIKFEDILKKFENRFLYSNKNALYSLATAEYLYINEKLAIDYSGIFMSYIKGFELEIRSRLNKKNRMTLNEVLTRLKKIPELTTFVKLLESLNIVNIRNNAAHNALTSKANCGKLRKILLEDRWLDRITELFNTMENNEALKFKKETYIEEYEGNEWYDGKIYSCYKTIDNYYILTKSKIKIGEYKIQGVMITINGIEYILVN